MSKGEYNKEDDPDVVVNEFREYPEGGPLRVEVGELQVDLIYVSRDYLSIVETDGRLRLANTHNENSLVKSYRKEDVGDIYWKNE